MEPGESLQQAVAREVAEETGLIVEVGQEVWQLTVALGRGALYEVHAFAAEVTGGRLTASDDAEQAGWFAPDTLNELLLTPQLKDFLLSFSANQTS